MRVRFFPGREKNNKTPPPNLLHEKKIGVFWYVDFKKVNWKKILGDVGDVPVPCRIILSFMPGETLSSRASLAVPCECHSLENWGGNSILLLQMLPHCPGNSVVVVVIC